MNLIVKIICTAFILAQPRQIRDDITAWSMLKTRDGDFKSIVTTPAGGTTPSGDNWTETQVWCVVERVIGDNTITSIEMFTPVDWIEDNYAWFVDGGVGPVNSKGVAEIPEIPEIPAGPDSYIYTYINQNATVWGIPIYDTTLLTLDAAAAVNVGGGTVGLPYTDNPFVSGEVIKVAGTTNYNGDQTLTAGTTTSQLQFTDTFGAETFDGTETVIRKISVDSGSGRMTQDSDGNLYIAHDEAGTAPNNYYITRIAPDGTITFGYEFLTPLWNPAFNGSGMGIKVTNDGRYLYLWQRSGALSRHGLMVKYDLSDGTLVWFSDQEIFGGFDMAIDADGNVYGTFISGTGGVAKYASATGAITRFSDMDGSYVVEVDDTLGILINAGAISGESNLWVSTLDGSASDEIALGATLIGTTHLTSDGEYIYAVTGGVLYKVSWDGSSLAIEDQTAPLGLGVGLYIDLYDNLVVVNQTAGGTEDDVLYFYDKGLAAISNTSGMYTSLLRPWAAVVGGSWQSGNIVFNGALDGTPAVPAVPAVPGVDPNFIVVDHLPPDVEYCVYADGISIGNFTAEVDANGTVVLDLGQEYDVIIAGINYWSKYESLPLRIGARNSNKKLNAIRFDLTDTYFLEYAMGAESTPMVANFNEILTTSVSYKKMAFPFGSRKMPTVYIRTDKPVPLGIRAIIPEVTIYGDY